MANNRYYIKCPVCSDELSIGKSLGDGVYNTRSMQGRMFSPEELLVEINSPVAAEKVQFGNGEVLGEIYEWIWKHMMECHKDEFKAGELFKIVSEYK